MAAKPLSDAQLQAAVAALTQTKGNVVDAAKLVGIKRSTFEHHVRNAVDRGLVDLDALRQEARAERHAPVASPRLPVTADECYEVIDHFIGLKRAEFKHPQPWQAKPEQRIVIAGDFHAPYHDPEAVAELIAREANFTDTLIISGDLFDLYSVSRFPKSDEM